HHPDRSAAVVRHRAVRPHGGAARALRLAALIAVPARRQPDVAAHRRRFRARRRGVLSGRVRRVRRLRRRPDAWSPLPEAARPSRHRLRGAERPLRDHEGAGRVGHRSPHERSEMLGGIPDYAHCLASIRVVPEGPLAPMTWITTSPSLAHTKCVCFAGSVQTLPGGRAFMIVSSNCSPYPMRSVPEMTVTILSSGWKCGWTFVFAGMRLR